MATGDVASGERYLELVREFPLRRLRSEADLDRAVAMLDKLCDLREDHLSPEEDEYMDVLGALVEQYEEIHWPMRADLEAGLLGDPDEEAGGTSRPSLGPTDPATS